MPPVRRGSSWGPLPTSTLRVHAGNRRRATVKMMRTTEKVLFWATPSKLTGNLYQCRPCRTLFDGTSPCTPESWPTWTSARPSCEANCPTSPASPGPWFRKSMTPIRPSAKHATSASATTPPWSKRTSPKRCGSTAVDRQEPRALQPDRPPGRLHPRQSQARTRRCRRLDRPSSPVHRVAFRPAQNTTQKRKPKLEEETSWQHQSKHR